MATEKVNLPNLREACRRMVRLIDEIGDPETDSSGARTLGFPAIADEIRFELDGADSCVPAVRARASEAAR